MTLPSVSTVEDMLNRLGSDFPDFVNAFVRGRYAFWLGSGISRSRMPDVGVLLERVVEFVRERAAGEGTAGPHAVALEAILDLAGLSAAEREGFDLRQPATSWEKWGTISQILCEKYDQVLDVPVGSEPEDYLVWTGLDVPGTYGDGTVSPDVEHMCVALLMLEGVVVTAVTSNWDDLIEKAFEVLAEQPEDEIRVIVKQEDFRTKQAPRELIKFHGCAVRALDNEAEYRDLLIARLPQIRGWSEHDDHKHMRAQLEARFSDRETVMMGLSAQDANMHAMFHRASANLERTWSAGSPALVLSEERLRSHHRGVLKATYSNYGVENREDIDDGAVLGAWAKPVLLALLLWTLTEKVVELVEKVGLPGLSDLERQKLNASLRHMRDDIGVEAAGGTVSFVSAFVEGVSTVLSIFRSGQPSPGSGTYEPLSSDPVGQAPSSRYFPVQQLGRLCVVLSLVARGAEEGSWAARRGTSGSLVGGAVRLESLDKTVRLFVVKDHEAWRQLSHSDDFDGTDPNVVVIHAGAVPDESSRSPRSRKRTGRVGAVHLSIADVCDDASSADDLFAELKQAGGFA